MLNPNAGLTLEEAKNIYVGLFSELARMQDEYDAASENEKDRIITRTREIKARMVTFHQSHGRTNMVAALSEAGLLK